MKMDWGYESETGQVWLFNVTPFTPHLPHWQCVYVCVCAPGFSLLCEVVLTSVCVCTDAPFTHLALSSPKPQCEQHNSWSPDTWLTCFCSLTCAPDTPNAHMRTLLVRALNGMNNRIDKQ